MMYESPDRMMRIRETLNAPTVEPYNEGDGGIIIPLVIGSQLTQKEVDKIKDEWKKRFVGEHPNSDLVFEDPSPFERRFYHKNQRRLKKLVVAPELFLDALTSGWHAPVYRIVENAIPDDATIVGAQTGHNGMLELILRSAEFEPVRPDEKPPIIQSPVAQVTDESRKGQDELLARLEESE